MRCMCMIKIWLLWYNLHETKGWSKSNTRNSYTDKWAVRIVGEPGFTKTCFWEIHCFPNFSHQQLGVFLCAALLPSEGYGRPIGALLMPFAYLSLIIRSAFWSCVLEIIWFWCAVIFGQNMGVAPLCSVQAETTRWLDYAVVLPSYDFNVFFPEGIFVLNIMCSSVIAWCMPSIERWWWWQLSHPSLDAHVSTPTTYYSL